MTSAPSFWTEDVRPAPTPRELARLIASAPSGCLLASAGKVSRRSRYTFAAVDPFVVVTGAPGRLRVEWRSAGRGEGGGRGAAMQIGFDDITPELPAGGTHDVSDPMPILALLLSAFPTAASPSHPPFTGGIAGWFGYDLGRAFEALPERVADPLALPTFRVGFYDLVLAIDRLTRKATIIATGYPERDPKRRAARARERVAGLRDAIEAARARARAAATTTTVTATSAEARGTGETGGVHAFQSIAADGVGGLASNLSRDEFLDAVRRVKNYIRAGDIYQANVTQRLRWAAPRDTAGWFAHLLDRNEVPFAAYMRCEDEERDWPRSAGPHRNASGGDTRELRDAAAYEIVSLSPERFLRVSADHIETAPIKGTRPRGADAATDAANARDLLASPKERAELVMIVDMLRNDLGRVAAPGSVEVPELHVLETYATVHHLVARVTARLREGRSSLDALRAAFPGGSISGAPKIRAMQIIDEVEPHARGLFMGAIGYIAANGEMDTSIAIRTAVVRDGLAHLQVGSGIVADSRAEDEYEETLHKAAAFLGGVRAPEGEEIER